MLIYGGYRKLETGIDVVNCQDFIEDVWKNPRTEEFRNMLLVNTVATEDCGDCRACPYYEV